MFTVHIKNNKTGEIRQHIEKDENWFDGSDFMWTEGNYSCDCNRALYFARANGSDDELAEGQDCGDNEAYSIPFVILKDGTKITIS